MTLDRFRFEIVVEPWGTKRFAVIVEPRTVDRPSRSFQSIDEALSYAEQLADYHGWPIRTRCS